MLHEIKGRETPPEILQIIIMQNSSYNFNISNTWYEEIKRKYPEYFKEEIDRDLIMKSIPDEVHNAYTTELLDMWHEYRPLQSSSKGILYYMDHWDEYRELQLKSIELEKKNKPIIEKLEKQIWNKYYKKYRLKYENRK